MDVYLDDVRAALNKLLPPDELGLVTRVTFEFNPPALEVDFVGMTPDEIEVDGADVITHPRRYPLLVREEPSSLH